MTDEQIIPLVQALMDAEAALIMLGHDIKIGKGRFVPVGTLALRNVREALLPWPALRETIMAEAAAESS